MKHNFKYKPYIPNAIIITSDDKLTLTGDKSIDPLFKILIQCQPKLKVCHINNLHLILIQSVETQQAQQLFKAVIEYLSSYHLLYVTQEIIFQLSVKQLIDKHDNEEIITDFISCIQKNYLKKFKCAIKISFYLTDLDYLCGFSVYKALDNIQPLLINQPIQRKSNLINTVQHQLQSLSHTISSKMIALLNRTQKQKMRLQLYTLPSQLERLNQPLSEIMHQLQLQIKSLYARIINHIYLDERSFCSDKRPQMKATWYQIFLLKKYSIYILAGFVSLITLCLLPLSLTQAQAHINKELIILKQPIFSIYKVINLYQYRHKLKYKELKPLTQAIRHYISLNTIVLFPQALLSSQTSFPQLIHAYAQLNEDVHFKAILPLIKQQILASLNIAWDHHTELKKFDQVYIKPLEQLRLKTNFEIFKQQHTQIAQYKKVNKLTITPLSLSSQIAKVILYLGSQTLTYQHGPEIQQTLSLESNTLSPCSIIFYTFDHRHLTDTFPTDYCLAHLLNVSHYHHSIVTHCHKQQSCFSFKLDNGVYRTLAINVKPYSTPKHITYLGVTDDRTH